MRFFSKIIFICNICFIAAVIFRYIEINADKAGKNPNVLGFQPLESTLIILGYGAVIFNFIFLLSYLIAYLFKKGKLVPKWILLFNLVLFIVQLIYFLY
jgi:hypothetical protein